MGGALRVRQEGAARRAGLSGSPSAGARVAYSPVRVDADRTPREPLAPAARSRAARFALVAALFSGVVACDHSTKRLAVAGLPEGRRLSFLGDVVRLERVRNPGGLLSLGGRLPSG